MSNEKRRVVVYHRGYGCETGCCGHVILLDDEEVPESFVFSHPRLGEDYLEFAKELVRDALGEEHVADLDWDDCYVSWD